MKRRRTKLVWNHFCLLSFVCWFFPFLCKTGGSSLKNKVPLTPLCQHLLATLVETHYSLFNRYALKAFFVIVAVEINTFLYWSILKKGLLGEKKQITLHRELRLTNQ